MNPTQKQFSLNRGASKSKFLSIQFMEFTCSNCRERLEITEEYAGQSAQCPFCQATVMVPVRPQRRSRRMWRTLAWSLGALGVLSVMTAGTTVFMNRAGRGHDSKTAANAGRVEPTADRESASKQITGQAGGAQEHVNEPRSVKKQIPINASEKVRLDSGREAQVVEYLHSFGIRLKEGDNSGNKSLALPVFVNDLQSGLLEHMDDAVYTVTERIEQLPVGAGFNGHIAYQRVVYYDSAIDSEQLEEMPAFYLQEIEEKVAVNDSGDYAQPSPSEISRTVLQEVPAPKEKVMVRTTIPISGRYNRVTKSYDLPTQNHHRFNNKDSGSREYITVVDRGKGFHAETITRTLKRILPRYDPEQQMVVYVRQFTEIVTDMNGQILSDRNVITPLGCDLQPLGPPRPVVSQTLDPDVKLWGLIPMKESTLINVGMTAGAVGAFVLAIYACSCVGRGSFRFFRKVPV